MTDAMTCPKCGAAMNHQADKLRDPRTREEAARARVFGGVVIAVFACPRCGWIASRERALDEH